MSNNQYSGSDNLKVMSYAVGYNQALFKWASKGISAQNRIVDFGAGIGEFANRFTGYDICAVEIEDTFLPQIKCPVYKSLADTKRKFNLIYSINVLEHIDNHATIVRDFHQHIEQHGLVRIFVPARMELYGNMDKHVGHFRRYHRKQLIELLENAGFTVNYCRYFDFAGYFLSLLYKWMEQNGQIDKKSIVFYDRFLLPISIFLDKLTAGRLIGKNLMIEGIKK